MAVNPNPTLLDMNRIFQQSYDEAQQRLRVDSIVTVSGGVSEVVISHLDDSIKIGDGVDFLAVNSDGSINVKTDGFLLAGTEDGTPTGVQHNAKIDASLNLHTRDDDANTTLSSINNKLPPALGPQSTANSLSVVLNGGGSSSLQTIPQNIGVLNFTFGEVLAVAPSVLTTITTYTTPALLTCYLQSVLVGGENVATFDVLVNGNVVTRKRTSLTYFSEYFDFMGGVSFGRYLNPGDVVTVKVIHTRTGNANFDTTIQVLEI